MRTLDPLELELHAVVPQEKGREKEGRGEEKGRRKEGRQGERRGWGKNRRGKERRGGEEKGERRDSNQWKSRAMFFKD